MGIYDRDYYQSSRQPGVHLGSEWSVVGKLIAVNAIVYIATSIFGDDLRRWLAASPESLTEPWKIWQLLTYGFVHAETPSHVIWNMFSLFVFGRDVESVYGRKEFTRIYLVSIVLGGLTFAVRNLLGSSDAVVVGASGAVTTIILLFCIHFPKRTLLLMFVLPVPAWSIGLLIIVGNVMGLAAGEANVAFDVHLAGAAFAIAYYKFGWHMGRWTPGFSGAGKLLKPKPKLKIHEPTGGDPYQSLDAQADQLLAKVKREGVDSLSESERRLLEDYSRRMRQKHS